MTAEFTQPGIGAFGCDIACIAGARPNFMKVAPLISEFRRRQWRAVLIHTGQHYSHEMSAAFFDDLGLAAPDVNLSVGSGTPTQQTAEVMRRLEPVFLQIKPRLVLVVGDVNSTLAAALVAAKMSIPIVHVEAGLRSFDRTMPEEINRMLTDALSELLFVTERSAIDNLVAEGIPRARIHFVGNVMIDSLLRCRDAAARSNILERFGLHSGRYAVATLHRPSNVDCPARLEPLLTVLRSLAKEIPIVFPVHPRTRQRMDSASLDAGDVIATDPLGYLDFVKLLSEARLVLTDSGGIQEETTILNVPCLTLRLNTERPVTIEQGTNRLAGTEPDDILQAAKSALQTPSVPKGAPTLWDGGTSPRIADILERFFGFCCKCGSADLVE